MAEVNPTQRLFDIVESIEKGEYRLPSIQRSFVWEEEQLYKLMDSIMNDYPIGSFLVWSPPENLQIRSRRFIREYTEGMRLISDEEPLPASTYLVLDGQQRFQSLYLSFFGWYDRKRLYFRLDSDPERPPEDVRYQFKFIGATEAQEDPHWVRPLEIVKLEIEDISKFVDSRFQSDTEPTRDRMKNNLGKFIRTFNIDKKGAFLQVKSNLDYNDVLEVFVRANSGGTILTKSDLVFSTIVLLVPEMEEKFIELVDEINAGGHFSFDTDLIVKASFVLFGKGAKYDVRKLQDKQYVAQLRGAFHEFKASLISTMEFLRNDAKILGRRFLKSTSALIPITDFIFCQSHQQVPEAQAISMRQYLYMSFFTRFFSYGGDGKLDSIHTLLNAHKRSGSFPVEAVGKYISDRMYLPYKFERKMLTDLDLVLNIVQDGVSEIPNLRGWSLERDHIFPKALLRGLGIVEGVDSVGNLRLLNKTRNILKDDNMPAEDLEFFGQGEPEVAEAFSTARRKLTQRNFAKFVKKREDLMFDRVTTFLGL